MNLLRVTLFILLSAFLPLSSSQEESEYLDIEWKYGESWDEFENCTKPGQSPIALTCATAVKEDAKTNVQFKWSRSQTFMNLHAIKTDNNVVLASNDFAETTIMGGVEYKVDILYYYWGSDASKGSGHSVDGKFFSGEIEVFHYKSDLGHGNAIEHSDGVLIVSILLEEDSTLKEDIKELRDFSAIFPQVQESDYQFYDFNLTEGTLSLSNLIPADGQFFRYTGGNSFPPCMKPIERIVFKTPLKVTPGFLTALRTFKFYDGTTMQDNFRPVQDLGDRTVYKSFE